jgi:DNA-binding transcriptional LysR family regulator
MEGTSPHTLFAMARGGNGVAVVPSSTRVDGRSLVSRPITLRGERVLFDICAMWDRRIPLPAYGRRFVESLRAHILNEEDTAAAAAGTARPHLHIV